jgi:Protein of unknown function (DUF3467)
MRFEFGLRLATPNLVEAHLAKEAAKKIEDVDTEIGIYVNHLAIGHNMSEVVLEFGQVFDEVKARQQARLITSPTHLRSFQALMADTIERYEDEFGPLPDVTPQEQQH